MLDLLIVAYALFVTNVKVQQSLYWPIADRKVFQEVEAPGFPGSWLMQVVRLSTLHTVQLYPPGNILGTHFFRG